MQYYINVNRKRVKIASDVTMVKNALQWINLI